EWEEYKIAPNLAWGRRIAILEKLAVLESDMRISVSGKLADYWCRRFGYRESRHVVIPCTLVRRRDEVSLDATSLRRGREALGIAPDHVVICYSGSAAQWQSLPLLDDWLARVLQCQSNVSLLFMSPAPLESLRVGQLFADRIHKKWVSPEKVAETMALADYGLLLRQKSVTNTVAAPTKFAEYLSVGLKILISSEVGDYSTLVEQKQLGHVVTIDGPTILLERTNEQDRQRLVRFASDIFDKSQYRTAYARLLDILMPTTGKTGLAEAASS